jgi:ElaB/YqjD/DUF883 family membrane-anchored ribosome-binding protein
MKCRWQLILLGVIGGLVGPGNFAFSQSEQDCLQSFDVKPDRIVTYIAINPTDTYKVDINPMSCVAAEMFREKLYVSMDKNLYDSESVLRVALSDSKAKLQKLRDDLEAVADKKKAAALMRGVGVTIATVTAIQTTAACASAVVNGVGVAACGAAVGTSYGAYEAWNSLIEFSGEQAELRANAQAEITKHLGQIGTLEKQLDATSAKNIHENYSSLFVAICRAVNEQCL